jgi:hypothetical protein
LYTNNKKLQNEKNNNPLCIQSLELVTQFLEHFECKNTLQIFESEAHYQRDYDEDSSLVHKTIQFINYEKSKVSFEICIWSNRKKPESQMKEVREEVSRKSRNEEVEKKGKLLKISLQGENDSDMVIKTESTPANQNNLNSDLKNLKMSMNSRKYERSENQDRIMGHSSQSSKNQGNEYLLKNSEKSNSKSNEWSSKIQDRKSATPSNVLVNNYMQSEHAGEIENDAFPKSGSGQMSQNENEEDFLKANSSRLNTDKESQQDESQTLQKQLRNEFQTHTLPNSESKQIYEVPLESESKYEKQKSSSSTKKNLIFEEDPEHDIQEPELMKEQNKSSPSKKLYFKEDERFEEAETLGKMGGNLEVKNQNETEEEDDEDLGLIAEPEAVDVSVLTENLEEFDHDETPQEILDSDEEHEDENEEY